MSRLVSHREAAMGEGQSLSRQSSGGEKGAGTSSGGGVEKKERDYLDGRV